MDHEIAKQISAARLDIGLDPTANFHDKVFTVEKERLKYIES